MKISKKLFTSIGLALIASVGMAQNIFPVPTGNAEIKSGNLLIETSVWRSSLLTLKDTHYNPDQVYHFQIESNGLKIKQDGVVNYNFLSGGNFLVRNGRVGIRTSDPKSYLHVYTSDANSATGIILGQGSDSGNRHSGRLFFENLGETSNSFTILKSGDRLSFRSGAIAGQSTGTERMSLTNAGRLGIGNTSPSFPLDVNGTGRFTDQLNLKGNSEAPSTTGANGQLILVSSVTNLVNTFGIYSDGVSPHGWIQPRHKSNFSVYYDLALNPKGGNVGIGTTNPEERLSVDGTIQSEEIRVEIVNGPDYVFESDYDLKSLEEIEQFIKSEKHLPEIPPAKEMEANGVELGEMNMLLLKKIEELTLHVINLQKQFKEEKMSHRKALDDLRREIEEMK